MQTFVLVNGDGQVLIPHGLCLYVALVNGNSSSLKFLSPAELCQRNCLESGCNLTSLLPLHSVGFAACVSPSDCDSRRHASLMLLGMMIHVYMGKNTCRTNTFRVKSGKFWWNLLFLAHKFTYTTRLIFGLRTVVSLLWANHEFDSFVVISWFVPGEFSTNFERWFFNFYVGPHRNLLV